MDHYTKYLNENPPRKVEMPLYCKYFSSSNPKLAGERQSNYFLTFLQLNYLFELVLVDFALE